MTRKIKTLFATGLMLLSINVLYAQEQSSPRKNELALDISPIFRMNNMFVQPPLKIMYRHKFGMNAMRIQLESNVTNAHYDNSSEQAPNPPSVSKGDNNSVFIDTRLGWQWNKNVGVKNLSFYYGGDLIFQDNSGKGTMENNNYSGNYHYQTSQTTKSNTYGFGIAPVLGLNLQLSNAFSMGVENSFDLIYTTQKANTETTYRTFIDGNLQTENSSKSTTKANGLNFVVSPVQNLKVFLSFHF